MLRGLTLGVYSKIDWFRLRGERVPDRECDHGFMQSRLEVQTERHRKHRSAHREETHLHVDDDVMTNETRLQTSKDERGCTHIKEVARMDAVEICIVAALHVSMCCMCTRAWTNTCICAYLPLRGEREVIYYVQMRRTTDKIGRLRASDGARHPSRVTWFDSWRVQ